MTLRDEDEKPLDPVTERLRKKMVRLLATAIGIMLVGVMAVLGAIVYKTSRPATPTPRAEIALNLPAGAVIEGMALDGDRALLRLTVNGAEELRLVSLADGSLITRVHVQAAAPK
ncbi:fimbrial protein [Jiella sp. M17.18]|uniref:fimbrial protein n=1 Tax=Jiella sp. M17.18 TaxID=3234247 RepID=UPI0034DF022B